MGRNITTTVSGGMEFQLLFHKSLAAMQSALNMPANLKCAEAQIGKGPSFQLKEKAMPKNTSNTQQLHHSHCKDITKPASGNVEPRTS